MCDRCNEVMRHGVPKVVMSDNGPQFSCGEFREFAHICDSEHVTSSPRYHQSNGQVERAIGTVKNIVKKAMEDGSDVQLALLNFRNTVREGYSAPQHSCCSVVDAEHCFQLSGTD